MFERDETVKRPFAGFEYLPCSLMHTNWTKHIETHTFNSRLRGHSLKVAIHLPATHWPLCCSSLVHGFNRYRLHPSRLSADVLSPSMLLLLCLAQDNTSLTLQHWHHLHLLWVCQSSDGPPHSRLNTHAPTSDQWTCIPNYGYYRSLINRIKSKLTNQFGSHSALSQPAVNSSTPTPLLHPPTGH